MASSRRSSVTVLLAMGTLVLSACGSSPSAPPSGPCPKGGSPVATNSITVRDFAFDPACITIAPGATVAWTNTGMPTHTVTSDTGAPVTFDSGALGTGGGFTQTFASPGTVNYHCTVHPSLMTGTIIVQ